MPKQIQYAELRTPKDVNGEALEDAIAEIWSVAKGFGLDPFPIRFEVVPAAMMYEFGVYGLPGRFSHWTHGKAYHQMKTMYDYGLSKIYELVINTNPCYAFLLDGNSLLQNKLVVAHVIAHCDFFKNNVYFQQTNRHMLDSASASAERIRHYEFQHGTLEVEKFLDAVLSIQEHVDASVFGRQMPRNGEGDNPRSRRQTPYDDLWCLCEPVQESERPSGQQAGAKTCERENDLLLFIMEHAPRLKDWQRDILDIVRAEAIYFLPQARTKIMNEGWASYWHSRIMRALDLTPAESVEFAKMHSSVLVPSRRSINPYFVGMRVFEDIAQRWDEPSDDERAKFGRPGHEGREKIFEVRSLESDAAFLRNYLSRQLVDNLDLYVYRQEDGQWRVVEKDWEKVRDTLVGAVVSMGRPCIAAEDADYHGHGELYLRHLYEGQPLDLAYADKTLRQIYALWDKPVHLETVFEGKKMRMTFDGEKNNRVWV